MPPDRPSDDAPEAVLLRRSRADPAPAPHTPPPRAARAARRARRGAARRRRRAAPRSEASSARRARGCARGRAVAGVAQARGAGRVEVDVAQQHLLAELRRPRDHPAGVVDHAGVPVEDELVLSADERAEGDAGEVVAGALGEHPLALGALAGVVGGGGDVDDQGRAGQRLVARRRARPPRCPRRRSGRPGARRARSARRRRRPGSSAARRRRRSWAGRPCGRWPAPRRSASTAARVVDVLGALGEADDRRDVRALGASASSAARASARKCSLSSRSSGG